MASVSIIVELSCIELCLELTHMYGERSRLSELTSNLVTSVFVAVLSSQ